MHLKKARFYSNFTNSTIFVYSEKKLHVLFLCKIKCSSIFAFLDVVSNVQCKHENVKILRIFRGALVHANAN